jgi:hypothetical protein
MRTKSDFIDTSIFQGITEFSAYGDEYRIMRHEENAVFRKAYGEDDFIKIGKIKGRVTIHSNCHLLYKKIEELAI